MQASFDAVSTIPNLAVYWFSQETLPKEQPTFTIPHCIFVDDAHDVDRIPEWIVRYSSAHAQGSLVLGCREYAARRFQRLAQASLKLSEIQRDEVDLFVSRIREFDAAEDSDLDLHELFLAGLDETQSGGLFPAMFAATRGEMLESRYSRVIESLPSASSELDALACLAFSNMIHLNSERRVPLLGSIALDAMADELDGPPSPAGKLLIKERLSRLSEEWEGEVRLRARGGIELRHESIVHIFFRWIFGAAPPPKDRPPRGATPPRRHKWPYYNYLSGALLKTKGQGGFSDLAELIRTSLSTMKHDLDRGITREPKSSPASIINSMIDRVIEQLGPKGQQLAELCLSMSRTNAYLVEITREEGSRRKYLEISVSHLAKALSLAPNDQHIMLSAAQIAMYLPQPIVVKLPSGVDADWHMLFGVAADFAEKSGDFGFAERVNRAYFRRLLAVRIDGGKSPGGIFTIRRYEDISALARKISLLDNSNIDEDRLDLLIRLANWTTHSFRDGAVPVGLSSDEFPSSRRSVYREIWRELFRLRDNKLTQRHFLSQSGAERWDKLRRTWLNDETAAGDTTAAWPVGTRNAPALLSLLESGNWKVHADAFPLYFPH
jgi:hypothetical protein